MGASFPCPFFSFLFGLWRKTLLKEKRHSFYRFRIHTRNITLTGFSNILPHYVEGETLGEAVYFFALLPLDEIEDKRGYLWPRDIDAMGW